MAAAAQGVGVRNLGLPRDKLFINQNHQINCRIRIILPKLFINQNHHTNRDPTLSTIVPSLGLNKALCQGGGPFGGGTLRFS